MKRLLPLSWIIPILAGTSLVCAQEDVDAGRKLASRVCAACHIISKTQAVPPILHPPAPSFATLARQHKFNEGRLRHFLATPHGEMGQHGKMPNPELADYQINRIIAYLLSLQTNKR